MAPDASAATGEDGPRKGLGGFLDRNVLIKHVAQLMTGTAAAQIVVMAFMPFLSRLYTTVEFGILATFTSIVALVSAIATLRYDMAIMLPKSDRDAAILKNTATWIAFLIGIVTTIACLLLGRPVAEMMNTPNAAPWLALAGIAAFTIAEIGALTYWLNRHSRYSQMASNRVLQSGATAVVQLGLAFVKPLGAGGLILGTIVGQAVSIFGLRRRARDLKDYPTPTMAERRRMVSRYRRMPLWNAPTALVDAVRLNGINLVIGALSMGALGQFSMAWRMVEIPSALIGTALAQVFFQRLSVIPRGRMTKAVISSVWRSALFGLVPFGLVFALSPWLFPFVFGASWADAGHFAQALTPWLFMNLITSPISTIFVVTERQHVSLLFSIVYTAVPLGILLTLGQGDLMFAVFLMGGAMAAMLLVQIALALIIARRYDVEKPAGPVQEAGA